MRAGIAARIENGRRLAEETKKWREGELELASHLKGDSKQTRIFGFILQADEVTYWSLLTLIYRATPCSTTTNGLNPQCVETARRALEVHYQCAQLHFNPTESDCELSRMGWGSYIDWFIIHLPFTPFIIIFCEIITSPASKNETRRTDLARLTTFMKTLRGDEHGHTSEAAEKMWRLCAVFHRVAEVFVNGGANGSEGEGEQEVAGVGVIGASMGPGQMENVRSEATPGVGQFEPYLNALGMPGVEGHGMGMDYGGYGDNWGGDAAGLESWFSGTQHLMGLLEEDLGFIQTL